MNNGRKFAFINVVIETEGRFYHIHSPELPGLTIAGISLDELFKDLPYLIRELFEDNYDMKVNVVKASELEEPYWKWAITENKAA